MTTINITVYISAADPRLSLIRQLISVTDQGQSFVDGTLELNKLPALRSTNIPFDVERSDNDRIVAEADNMSLFEALQNTCIKPVKWISRCEIVLSDPLGEATGISALSNIRPYIPSKLTWKPQVPWYEYDITIFDESMKERFLDWVKSRMQVTYDYELVIRVKLENAEDLQLLLDHSSVARITPYSPVTLC